MRSPLDVRLGSQEPTILHQPPDVHSLAAAEEAIELADAYGICDGNPLAESQKITLRGAMAERADGTWAASRVGDFGPRQGTGKNDKIAARELAGLILLGEPLIIHTAHEFPTANEAFLRLVALFENYDDLRSKVRRVLYGNGTQSINLRSGQRILYKARTGGSARGFTKAALVVYDEAQHLIGSHVAASAPAKLANPNSQSWFAGSGGLSTSVKAWAMRRDAILGTGGRLAYTEMTAETIEVVDGKIVAHAPNPLDLDAWYRSMPGLGRWVTEESMRALYDELGAEDFAREGLCVWDPDPGASVGVIPITAWAGCRDPLTGPVGDVAFSLDISPNRDTVAFGVSAESGRGGVHVEVISHGPHPGTEWLVGEAHRLQDVHGGTLALVAGSPAASLIEAMEAGGVRTFLIPAAEYVQACGDFYDAVIQGDLSHLEQPELTSAVMGADRKWSGDAWYWARRQSTEDITPLVAVTTARWAHLHAPVPAALTVW